MANTEPERPASVDPSPRSPHVYGEAPKVRNWGRASRSFALGALVVFAGLFVLSNRQAVEIDLVVTSLTIGLVWVLVAMFVAGWIGHMLWAYTRNRAVKKATSRAKK